VSQQITHMVDELHQAADSYTPPPVPIDQLLATGRRRRRRKQGLTVIATAAAAAAAIIIGLVAVPSIRHNAQPARGSSMSIDDHIRFVLPPGWREIPNTIITGAAGGPSKFWTNQPTTPSGRRPQESGPSCLSPITKLHRNGVLVSVGLDSFLLKQDFHPNTTVAGRPASITTIDVPTAPPESGGAPPCVLNTARILHVEILADSPPWHGRVGVLYLNAHFGPGDTHRLEQQMRHVLTTARPALTSQERHAALAAVHRNANRYAVTDPHLEPQAQGWPRNIAEVTAKAYPGPVTGGDVKHSCHMSPLLKVTLIGRFPHIAVSPPPHMPGQPTPSAAVHAVDVVVTRTGVTCQTGVRTGQVRPDPAAVVLFER